MRFSRRFLVFAIIIAATLFWKFNNWNDRYAAVETFRGAALNEDVLYPLMSKNLNDSGQLKVYINDQLYQNTQAEAILDDGLNPAGSLEFIRTVLKGSAFLAGEDSAVVQITNDSYKFKPISYLGETYISLRELCSSFGYNYKYDKATYTVTLSYDKEPTLPKKYDLRSIDRISVIRNQGSTSTCWACASLEALESSLLPYNPYLFSVDSMITDNSFGLDETVGGHYKMALAYLLAWQGPIDEKAKDEADTNLLTGLTEAAKTPSVHVQEAHFYDSEDLDSIKWAVYQYGGVSASIYASVSSSNLNASASYNRKTNSYCYTGNNKPNHDVVIIGWDDKYSADNFGVELPGDGAFICQNSWGTGFGDDGVFYVSYYDSNIGNQAVSFVKVDTKNTYSSIYQSDLCGWIGETGFNKPWAYGANTFVADADQQIEAAGFYALGKDTSYQLYFVNDYENTSSLSNKELVAAGTLKQKGYYTIKFNSPKTVKAGESFAVVLYISTPDELRPLAIEYVSDARTAAVDINDGKGFISTNGLDWENIEDRIQGNLCIKAYGNSVVEVFEGDEDSL